jgi:nitroreductase/NAD-dependent dihydropyrimidine dehydrogenase PreA subunit
MAATIHVDRKACVSCGACLDVCTARVYALVEGHSEAVEPDRCWGCGHCVAVCPADAIDHPQFPLEQCPLLDHGTDPGLDGLVSAFRGRRSIRSFHAQTVDRDAIRSLLEAGRWAPTASNRQPVDWVVLDDPVRIREVARATAETLALYGRWLAFPPARWVLQLRFPRETVRDAVRNAHRLVQMKRDVDAGRDPILFHAPALLVAHTPGHAPFDRDDAAYAAYNVMLAATRMGLGTCQIGLLQLVLQRRARVRRLVGIPAGRTSQIALVLGTPLHAFRRSLPRRAPNMIWNPE